MLTLAIPWAWNWTLYEYGVEILVERMHACLDLGQGMHISGSQDGLRL